MSETYKGWSISPPDMCPFWTATGPNYDASYEGPEDGWVDNGEKVEARTYKDLLVEIEDFIACADGGDKPENEEKGSVGMETEGRNEQNPLPIEDAERAGDGAAPSAAAKVEAYEAAHETAVQLGYPSITEALERLEALSTDQVSDVEVREAVDLTELRKAAEAVAKIAPGLWGSDIEKGEGSYGEGDEDRTGFMVPYMETEHGKRLFDAHYCDVAEIHEEYDEDGVYAWDENARLIFNYLAMVQPANILALIDRSQPKGAGQSSGEVAAVALLREIFPPADLATYDGEPDDVERSQWVTNGARRRISALLSGTATDKSNHKPECWGRTSFSDEVAHCYCATDNADGLSADREVDSSHGSVYDRLLTFIHDRDDALRGDGRTDPHEIDETVLEIMKITAPAGQDLAAEVVEAADRLERMTSGECDASVYSGPSNARLDMFDGDLRTVLAALKDRA